MRFAPALAVMLWAGAACAQEVAVEVPQVTEDLPPGYPPKLGEAHGTLGKKSVAWEFFDFSIGAFDASAWVDSDWETKQVGLHLGGHTPGKPEDKKLRLRASGAFGAKLHVGAANDPLIEVLRGADADGPRLSSQGERAELVIESIGPKQDNSYLRHVTGHLSARLCPQNWPFKACQDIALDFASDVQFGSAAPVAD